MSNNKDWDKRNVDFARAHGDDSDAFNCLVRAMNLRQGMAVADIMGGYGGVSREILEHCDRGGMGINIILSDASGYQIEKSKDYLKGYEARHCIARVIEDVRAMSFPDRSLDAAVIKLGLHEVPLNEQLDILRGVHKALRTNSGTLYLWECATEDKRMGDVVREIIRTKDRLAGYDDMVKNRHFSDFASIEEMLKQSGYEQTEIYRNNYGFRINTANLLESDFKGDVQKLDKLNKFIRELNKEDKTVLKFQDFGDSVEFSIGKRIYSARAVG